MRILDKDKYLKLYLDFAQHILVIGKPLMYNETLIESDPWEVALILLNCDTLIGWCHYWDTLIGWCHSVHLIGWCYYWVHLFWLYLCLLLFIYFLSLPISLSRTTLVMHVSTILSILFNYFDYLVLLSWYFFCNCLDHLLSYGKILL